MGDILTGIIHKFKRGDISIKLIYVNVAIYLVVTLIFVSFKLFNRDVDVLHSLFELPASFPRFITRPWTLLTYMFMHADLFHLFFNMLWLYWFGSMFLYFFSAKHLRGLYILGGICGGILYMVSYNIFPFFAQSVEAGVMVGASASILAIVVATAYQQPNYSVRLLFLGAIRLKYIALFVVVTDLLFLASSNAGGHFAHLGGALAGLLFAVSLSRGRMDITAWINKIIDLFAALFDKKTWKRKRKPTMKVHYNRSAEDYDYNARKKAQSDEIDRILDKLKKSGYDSLTTEEKKSLFDASKR